MTAKTTKSGTKVTKQVKKGVAKQFIDFYKQLQSIQTPDCLDKHPFEALDNGTLRAVVLPSLLPPSEQAIVKDFLQTLNVEKVDNFGISLFDSKGVFIFFSQPTVGLLPDNTLSLQIGINQTGEPGYQGVQLPLTYDPGLRTYKIGVASGEGENAKEPVVAKLVQIPNPMNPQEMRNYITFRSETSVYHITFKVDKERASEIDFTEHWDNGTFHEVVEPFYKSSINLSNVFFPTFKEGTFPRNGVLMLLKNGSIQKKEWNNQTLISTRWTLVSSSHPDLLVVTGKTKDKEGQLITLDSAGTVFAPSSCNITKQLLSDAHNEHAGDFCILHVQGPNRSGTLTHIPTHTSTTNAHGWMMTTYLKLFPQVAPTMQAEIANAPNAWLEGQGIQQEAKALPQKDFDELTDTF